MMMRSVRVIYNGERAKAQVAKYSKITRLEIVNKRSMISVPVSHIKAIKISRPFTAFSGLEYIILFVLLFASFTLLPVNPALTILTLVPAWVYWYKLFQAYRVQVVKMVIVIDSLDHDIIILARNKDVSKIVSKLR